MCVLSAPRLDNGPWRQAPGPRAVSVVGVEGALRMPLDGELRRRVSALLGRDERTIVLDLARVSAIDAAGVGELVRAYNATRAANGALRIARPAPRVREILDRAGLLALLSATPASDATGWPALRPGPARLLVESNPDSC